MDLRAAILKEHSRKQTDKIVKWIGKSEERFAELIELFFNAEYRIVQRASWAVNYVAENNPPMIQPYLGRLIKNYSKTDIHPAVKRNTIRLLQFIDIPKKFHGPVMNICFNAIESNTEAVAVKAFALSVLEKLSKQYPEILPEIRLIINARWEHETAAFRSRAKRIL